MAESHAEVTEKRLWYTLIRLAVVFEPENNRITVWRLP